MISLFILIFLGCLAFRVRQTSAAFCILVVSFFSFSLCVALGLFVVSYVINSLLRGDLNISLRYSLLSPSYVL